MDTEARQIVWHLPETYDDWFQREAHWFQDGFLVVATRQPDTSYLVESQWRYEGEPSWYQLIADIEAGIKVVYHVHVVVSIQLGDIVTGYSGTSDPITRAPLIELGADQEGGIVTNIGDTEGLTSNMARYLADRLVAEAHQIVQLFRTYQPPQETPQ